MTDRELLELAAKAARLEVFRYGNELGYRDYHGGIVVWNPLHRDGDALRLAVRLRLEPRFIDNSHSNGVEPSRVALHNFAGIVENIDGDPSAAFRRVIVRAAAEIGKGMK